MSKKKTIWWIILILSFVALLFGCAEHNHQKEIASIYVWHSSFGYKSPEYKIDFRNKQVWKYSFDESFPTQRNEASENEGFNELITELSDDKIAVFNMESARHGFTRWKERYDKNLVCDGHQWGIMINFVDGTQKEIYGSNDYPRTWNDMRKDFIDLTGVDILEVDQNWLQG